jgi:hypothetical protein
LYELNLRGLSKQEKKARSDFEGDPAEADQEWAAGGKEFPVAEYTLPGPMRMTCGLEAYRDSGRSRLQCRARSGDVVVEVTMMGVVMQSLPHRFDATVLPAPRCE